MTEMAKTSQKVKKLDKKIKKLTKEIDNLEEKNRKKQRAEKIKQVKANKLKEKKSSTFVCTQETFLKVLIWTIWINSYWILFKFSKVPIL